MPQRLKVRSYRTAPAILLVLAALTAPAVAGDAGRAVPEAVVPKVQGLVQPLIQEHLADAWTTTAAKLQTGAAYHIPYRAPCRTTAARDPWKGLADLETAGLTVAHLAAGGEANLGPLLEALLATMGKTRGDSAAEAPETPAAPESPASTLDEIIERLRSADALRNQALAKVGAQDREFLFLWPATMVQTYGPQLPYNEQTQPLLMNTRALAAFAAQRYDWTALLTAAKTLASIADARTLAALRKETAGAEPVAENPEGVTGTLLMVRETDVGRVLIGGTGPNTYDLKEPPALLIDLGGNDVYKGMIAATGSAAHPHSVVIDMDGDDTYAPAALGLATGRAGGVGLLIDRRGNDRYDLAVGTGGAGLGGIGILVDAEGDDVYTGRRFTQGAALGGLGLLLDLAGADKHTSFGNALGFAGPAGVAAVIDAAGNDSYQCGGKYPSAYNSSIKPPPEPGDPKFQYFAMGMGAGQGRRVLSNDAQHAQFNLAGGVGMMIDLAGRDTYESSNFSQGTGYFFGVGLKLDLAGDDTHGAARYGHASGAHFGMGLFADYAGRDRYTSTGPTYNCGCAWDHSIFLFADAGREGDTYDLDRSTGPGRADIGGWGVAVDLGGDDRYVIPRGAGRATREGLAVFLDAGGTDTYEKAPAKDGDTPGGDPQTPADGRTFTQGKAGGLFADQAE